jgi:WD40 repeat protein
LHGLGWDPLDPVHWAERRRNQHLEFEKGKGEKLTLKSKPVGHLGPKGDFQGSSTLFDETGQNMCNVGHEDMVTDLLMIPKLQYLASSSLDRRVILWDTINGDQRRVYSEHTMVK